MPYGTWNIGGRFIENDLGFVDKLVAAVPEFMKDEIAHRSEHSIEVQLPLLARYFPNSRVVGILIGRSDRAELLELANQFSSFLACWETTYCKRTLLIASSDLNHYANDTTTRAVDKLVTDALETTRPEVLYEVVTRNGITMCGILPTFMMLSALKNLGRFNRAIKIGYATSGDATGERERVVGYAGYLFK